MKIIVTVKQVPDTTGKVSVKPDGTLDRASMETVTNPDDLNAVEAALQLKDQYGARVITVTMGPMQAESMLSTWRLPGEIERLTPSAIVLPFRMAATRSMSRNSTTTLS